MEPRRFTRSQRTGLYIAADGRCVRCDAVLGPDFHADHITPWAKGGATDVTNGQALCPPCNLEKGTSTMPEDLRQWQVDALNDFDDWVDTREGTDLAFLLEATPAAGKTRFGIEATKRLFDRGLITQVFVVVPTRHLESQWKEAFQRVGLAVDPHWHAKHNRLNPSVHGAAVTYNEVMHSTQTFRRIASAARTCVIFDEVHHCGEGNAFGTAMRDAFDPAFVKLSLSATPERTDGRGIPFNYYEHDGYLVANFACDYTRALDDGIVRHVDFRRFGGTVEWRDNKGEVQTKTFDDDLAADLMQQRLRTILAPGAEWLGDVLGDANARVTEQRKTDRDAAAIVFCEDTFHARTIHKSLRDLGEDPALAISDEPDADKIIRDFRESNARWIVVVRMVSEGVDIPRLRVGVYATPWVTELFFRQAVGRVVRKRNGDPSRKEHATFYIPDDPRLRQFAAEMLVEMQRARRHDGGDDDVTGPGGGEPYERGQSQYMPIASTAEDRGTIVSGDRFTSEEWTEAARLGDTQPTGLDLSTSEIANWLRTARRAEERTDQRDMIAELEEARSRNNALVGQIVRMEGDTGNKKYAWVNTQLNRAVDANLNTASLEQLQLRAKLAETWLRDGAAPGDWQ